MVAETKKGMADVPRSGIGTQPEPLKHRQADPDLCCAPTIDAPPGC